MPFYKQKSQQWLDQRNNYLTASTIAAALGAIGPVARQNLLLNKASYGKVNPFYGSCATHWGTKYEPVANHIYAMRNHAKIYDFGMITNEKYPILGISPDGILLDRMLEIKCPYSRIIDGKIKVEYYHQMQEQMTVCDYDQCDFLECRFTEVSQENFWEDFYFDGGLSLPPLPRSGHGSSSKGVSSQKKGNDEYPMEKGIIMACLNINESEIEYIYSPIELYQNREQLQQWEQDTLKTLSTDHTRIFIQESYWNLVKYHCQLVKRDPSWIEISYPILEKFWQEVLHYRKVGVDRLIAKIERQKEKEAEDNLPDIHLMNMFKYDQTSASVASASNSKKRPHCLL